MSHESRTFLDGATVRARPEDMDRVVGIKESMASAKLSWKEGLEALGVKAIHPDDGWVTRYLKPGDRPSGLQNYTRDGEFESIHWAYPDLLVNLESGDLIALGWPAYSGDKDPMARTRLVLYSHTSPYQDRFPERGPWRWHFVSVVRVPSTCFLPIYRADVILDREDMVIADKRDPSAAPRPATPNEVIAARDFTASARENLRQIEGLFKGIFDG